MRSPISQASLYTKQPNCINQLPSPLELPPKLNLLSTHSRAQRKEASLLLDLLQNVRGRLVMAVSQKWGYIRIITGTILGGALGFYVMHRLETRHKVSSAPPISKPSFWLLINIKKWKKIELCWTFFFFFCCCENRRKWMRDWKSMKPNWRRKRRSMSLKNPCSFGVLSKFSRVFYFYFLFDTIWLLIQWGKGEGTEILNHFFFFLWCLLN